MQNRFVGVLLILLLPVNFLAGQKQVNSPYARYNIGNLEPAGSFRSLGMGGVATAIRDNSSLYYSNPASYSSIDTNSFIFDFGIDYSMNFLSDASLNSSSDDMNFDHLLMGFPLTKKWGFGIGLVPIANGYYKLSRTITKNDPGYDPAIGKYTSFHTGDGSLTNFFFGTGLNLTKNFSVGVNLSWLFGQLRRVNQFDFDDFYYVFNDNSTEKLRLAGMNINYGVQYSASLKNDYYLNAGVSWISQKNYKSRYELSDLRYTAYSTTDTVNYSVNDSVKTNIPGTLSLGISFGKKNKFTVGVDYVSTRWSAARIPGSEGFTADTRSVLMGIEFIPDRFSNYSLLKRIEYRLGGHIEDNYLIINSEQVKEIGASFGIGVPLRRTQNRANFFIDYTRKTGSQTNNLHTENYYTMGISLNIHDVFWFMKQRYQ
jgi:hypothetical protein